jgi:Ni,Fe-hydrogenase III component G
MWTEQERAGEHRECAERYGLDVVCIAGHRRHLTPEDFRKHFKLNPIVDRKDNARFRNNKPTKR